MTSVAMPGDPPPGASPHQCSSPTSCLSPHPAIPDPVFLPPHPFSIATSGGTPPCAPTSAPIVRHRIWRHPIRYGGDSIMTGSKSGIARSDCISISRIDSLSSSSPPSHRPAQGLPFLLDLVAPPALGSRPDGDDLRVLVEDVGEFVVNSIDLILQLVCGAVSVEDGSPPELHLPQRLRTCLAPPHLPQHGALLRPCLPPLALLLLLLIQLLLQGLPLHLPPGVNLHGQTAPLPLYHHVVRMGHALLSSTACHPPHLGPASGVVRVRSMML